MNKQWKMNNCNMKPLRISGALNPYIGRAVLHNKTSISISDNLWIFKKTWWWWWGELLFDVGYFVLLWEFVLTFWTKIQSQQHIGYKTPYNPSKMLAVSIATVWMRMTFDLELSNSNWTSSWQASTLLMTCPWAKYCIATSCSSRDSHSWCSWRD